MGGGQWIERSVACVPTEAGATITEYVAGGWTLVKVEDCKNRAGEPFSRLTFGRHRTERIPVVGRRP